ncbi:ATP-binding cassette domain-containing protein [Verminephrobacter aporrectodeae subsp. tuberculatae]|uniref:ABC transporter ATP-binding protein n=1 Tax=Verminephrobacter aporrectodeae TaxID=1110389 RepID=UPI002242C9ED|nr:ABC transporter ATP-binding protein/permease [Verminephrobacter aporrectodeae]MCW8198188.1 ATP-binding cassette domain-containing protein [Verminephrobacter aporrectodeae subsp. tuberculatae]
MIRWFRQLLHGSATGRDFSRYLWLTWIDILLIALPPVAAAEFIRQAYLQEGWPASGAIFLGIALGSPLLRLAVQWKARMLGAKTVFAAISAYRRQLVRRVLATPLWQLHKWPEGQWLERLGGDIRQIQEGIFIVLVRLQVNLLLAAILLLYVGYYRPEVLGGFLLALALCLVVGRRLLTTITRHVDELNECNMAVRARLATMMDGIRTLRLFGATRLPALRLDTHLQAQRQAQQRAIPALAVRDQIFHALLELCLILGLLLAWRAQADADLLPVLLILPIAHHNLYGAWQEWGLLKWTRQAWVRVQALAELPQQLQGATPLPGRPETLSVSAVGFAYADRPVLDAVDARFSPGSHSVVVGRNGAGKSTLLMVLARLYDHGDGQILLGDVPIHTATLGSWRAHVAVVLQDTALLPGTLRDNLLLGRPDAKDEELNEALHKACCNDFVAQWEGGLDTVLSEGGVIPSEGERQRIAIARALLKDAPIVLLDEVTSGLDSVSASQVQQAIQVLARHRTVIQVTHSLLQAVRADQVLVLSTGKVIETGKHAALLHADRTYAALWSLYQRSLQWRVTG